jgi:hypothetical protein
MTREEIITIVKDCAARLGHAPTVAEFDELKQVSRHQIRAHFGTHRRMLFESGVEARGTGHPLSMAALFLDWASVTRSLGKVPSVVDYQRMGKYSPGPLTSRCGQWREVPNVMMHCAREAGLEEEWRDVLDIVARHQQRAAKSARAHRAAVAVTANAIIRARVLEGQPSYGRPLPHAPLSYAPTNEAGVVLLFGSMARGLGFVILRAQAVFPDCEAMREIEPNRWQRVRIEFEYESHNFFDHMHPAQDCDLIVCWKHNWEDCPLEVLELESVVETLRPPGSQVGEWPAIAVGLCQDAGSSAGDEGGKEG